MSTDWWKPSRRTFDIHWQWYRDFFGAQILRYFVVWFSIVPVLAHTFAKLPNQLSLQVGQYRIDLNTGLPFDWQLLWVASVFYTTALLIYKATCPDFIRKYHSYGEYRDHGHSPRWIVYLVRSAVKGDVKRHANDSTVLKGNSTKAEALCKWLVEKQILVASTGDPSSENISLIAAPASTQLIVRYAGQPWSLEMPVIRNGVVDREATDMLEQDVFWEVFEYYAKSKAVIRYVLCGFLAIAFLLSLWVLAQHIISALPYVVHRWWPQS
jgi:hypothetical protein